MIVNEEWFARPTVLPHYGRGVRLHEAEAITAYLSRRLILSARHNHAANIMRRAAAAERDNPAPLAAKD